MRWLPLVALVACSKTSTNAVSDASIDAKPFFDARIDARLPLDAYVPRACDAPAMFAEGLTPTRVIHVYPGAINGDGSAERPFGSVAAAAADATPGTFIKLAPGTHAPNQFIADLTGTASAPIWIGGDYSATPTAKIAGGAEGLHLTRPKYVVIQNLEIGFQGANAINIEDGVSHNGAHHVALVNVYVHDVPSTSETTCIKAIGVDNLHIYDSRIRRCGVGLEAIGVHGAVVARNVFDTTGISAARMRGGSTDIDFRQNRILDGGVHAVSLGGFTPLWQFRPALSTTSPNAEARRIRAFNNMVYGEMAAPFAFDGCVDCIVAHNFVTGSPNLLLRILHNTTSQGSYAFEPTKNGLVVNNSFTWSLITLVNHVEVGVGASASTFTFSHNLWHCNDVPSSSMPQLPVGELGSVIGTGTGYTTALGSVYCVGPEAGAATQFLSVVDGTIEGNCRAGYPPTIGPHAAGAGCEI
ncbi:MAG TPA: hypothetical protein VIV11_24380 [Kofleriaceae bacterium]